MPTKINFFEHLSQSVCFALAEDIGQGDVNAQLVSATRRAQAHIVCKEAGVVCGTAWVNEVFYQLDPNVRLDWQVQDGSHVQADDILVTLNGPARALLSGERAALNFLQTLSGTASIANRYAQACQARKVRLLDTRKTIPGLRLAQKYAVLIGGGENHRIGLFDAFLIKENHIMACGSIGEAVRRARKLQPDLLLEIETETLEEVQEALIAGVDRIMLDEFDLPTRAEAVALIAGQAETEVSGSLDIQGIDQSSFDGIDFVSVGALTKHVQALDLSMRITLTD